MSTVVGERARDFAAAYQLAVSFGRMGDCAQTLEWLEKALGERSSDLPSMKWDPLSISSAMIRGLSQCCGRSSSTPSYSGAGVGAGVTRGHEINNFFGLACDVVVAANVKIAKIPSERMRQRLADVEGVADAQVMHLGVDADANRTLDDRVIAPFLHTFALLAGEPACIPLQRLDWVMMSGTTIGIERRSSNWLTDRNHL